MDEKTSLGISAMWEELERLKVENTRLLSENAQLQGQQSAASELAASEVDDLREEISARDRRIAELEAELIEELEAELIEELEAELIEEMAARMWADEIFRYEGHLTWAEVRESEKEADRQKARAVLEKKEAEHGII